MLTKILNYRVVFDILDVVNSYIKKDIKDLFRIDNPYAFNKAIKLLALHAGDSINFTNLTTICGISRSTFERYLFILESTFIIRLINPFYSNRIKEVVKMPKLYFMDTGIRNIIVGDLNSLEGRRDSGSLVENSVFLMLLTGKGPLKEIFSVIASPDSSGHGNLYFQNSLPLDDGGGLRWAYDTGRMNPTRIIRRIGVSPVSVIPAHAGIHLFL